MPIFLGMGNPERQVVLKFSLVQINYLNPIDGNPCNECENCKMTLRRQGSWSCRDGCCK